MKEINWVQIGSNYIANLQYGRVVIVPNDSVLPFTPYTVRIEAKSGEIVATDSLDLESCKQWAAVNLPLMDQATGDFSDCGNVVETLDLCQQLLSLEVDASHWLRIEHVKKWVAKYSKRFYQIVEIPLSKPTHYELDWQENGSLFIAYTPHGQAVIEETRDKNIVGGGIRHKARLVHRTGAVLNCGSYIDFMEADKILKCRLPELDQPYIDEIYLDNLDFTFAICERLLPEDTDPIHYARLEILKMRIHLTLD